MKMYSEKNIKTVTFVAIVGILFVALNILGTLIFSRWYFDTTEDKRYSLSDETLDFLKNTDKKFVVRLYVSNDLNARNSVIGNYAKYLRELFEKYQNKSYGKIDFSVIDVVPFTSSQVEAENAGIREFTDGRAGNYMYLGASFTNNKGDTQSIPYFLIERQKEVEADITRVLSILEQERKPTVGVISPYFRVADENNPLRYAKNFPFIEQLIAKGYEILPINASTPSIPSNIDTLLVFYPINMSKNVVYAMDQYLMRGGNIIIMLDAFSEARFSDEDVVVTYNSGLQKFLNNLGVRYSDNMLVGDNEKNREFVMNRQKMLYPLWPVVSADNDADNEVVKDLNSLYFNHSGFFEYTPLKYIKTKELLTTGKDSGIMNVMDLADINYDKFLKNYHLSDKQYPLVLLLEGRVNSLFDRPLIDDANWIAKNNPFLSVALKDAKVLLIADSDMVANDLWNYSSMEDYNVYGGMSISDNMVFLLRAIDYMTNSGYIALKRKNVMEKQINLTDVLYQKSVADYEEQKQKIENNLADVKRQKVVLEEEIGLQTFAAAKKIKQLEEIKRAEANEERKLKKINFEIEKTYLAYLSKFRLILILSVPMIFMLIVGVGYWIYNRSLLSKAQECIHE